MSAAKAMISLDADVELLPDVPISAAQEDLLERDPLALRLVELACAHPIAQPRVVALVGGSGAGKSSLLNLAVAHVLERGDVALVKLDAADHPGAEAVLAQMTEQLTVFFAEAGVVDAADSVRDRLASYGEVVSGVARVAGVKVDVGGALRRSTAEVRAEIAEMTQEVGKRIVIVIDHLDRLPAPELAAATIALRHYAAIPYLAFVLTLDRRDVARRLAQADRDPVLLERLIGVELALPPADRTLLARVIAGGLARVGARLGRDIDALLPLFDPGQPGDRAGAGAGPALALVETPRDAKRVVNAIVAALPLWAGELELRDRVLDAVIRLLVPALDGAPLDTRAQVAGSPAQVAALLAELERLLTGHRRAAAARAALRALLGG